MRRRPDRAPAGRNLEIREVEVPGLQEISLDLLARVTRHDLLLEWLDRDAERLEVALVALELAAYRLARLFGAAGPVRLVVLHLAQDLLAGYRIVVIEEEGEEVEPALGLGHAEDSARSRST